MLGAEWRDRVVIFGGCILAFILSASLGLIDSIHDYLDDLERFQADEVLTALMMAAVGLVWSSHRRLMDFRRELVRRVETEASLARTEQRLMDAIESMPDGLVLLDADRRFVMRNSRYREFYPQLAPRLTPGTPASEIVRTGAEDAGPHDHSTPIGTARATVLGSGQITPDQECQLATGRWIRVSDRSTREGGLVGIRTDITSLKLNEEALREASRRAGAARTVR